MAAPPHAAELVLMLSGTVTVEDGLAEELGTLVFAKEKQPLVNGGLLEMTQEMVPVYPSWGVMVMVEEPDAPVATVGLVAVRRKLSLSTTRVETEGAKVASPE